MGISFDKALGVHQAALQLRTQRASLLAGNIANADTPNYQAKDIDFQAALKAQMGTSTSSLSMKSTVKGHINQSSMQAGEAETLYRIPGQPSIDGNTVDEQVEHAEFMKNNLEFQATFTFLNSKFKGLTKAIRGE
ncbi:flagellar basal body rod protein FlgB [Teredinibacter sp. KSP-S5-2]|uniref:flagellar basal body rod protein FlgB n=1 Tax=Teredinibacter sp. KSP-S5-2 TaxID=3034506 RepID=UPI0029341B33|nr:flagellar basal body rod protein FlgB [Teredinibacter sp. KSP-S5-2]WNO07983.1 flagellar basal body rod protein FlgB [Teredinibacter sp. KSP-S5-2]